MVYGTSFLWLAVLLFFCGCSFTPDTSLTPPFGDEIHIGLDMTDYDPNQDPYLETSGSIGILSSLIHSTLFKLTGDTSLEPELGIHVLTNAQKNEWIMTLRDSVYFHDGSKLTAQDVKNAYERIQSNPESQFNNLLSSLKSISVQSETELKFVFERYDVFFIYALQLIPIVKINPAQNNSLPKFVGSGAFQIESYDSHNHVLTLAPNTRHFGAGPYLKKVRVHFLSNYLDGLAMIMKQELDLLYLADPTYEKIFTDHKDYLAIFQKKPIYYIAELNTSPGHLFHSQSMRQTAFASLSNNHIFEKLKHISNTVKHTPYLRADATMQAATKTDSSTHVMDLISFKEHEFSNFITYQLMQSFYPQGIRLNAKPYPLNRFLKKLATKDYDLALYPANFSFDDYYIYQYIHQSGLNSKSDVDFNPLLAQLRFEPDNKKRQAAFDNLQSNLTNSLPFVIFLQRHVPIILNKRFNGYNPHPTEIMNEIENMWVNKKDQKYL